MNVSFPRVYCRRSLEFPAYQSITTPDSTLTPSTRPKAEIQPTQAKTIKQRCPPLAFPHPPRPQTNTWFQPEERMVEGIITTDKRPNPQSYPVSFGYACLSEPPDKRIRHIPIQQEFVMGQNQHALLAPRERSLAPPPVVGVLPGEVYDLEPGAFSITSNWTSY